MTWQRVDVPPAKDFRKISLRRQAEEGSPARDSLSIRESRPAGATLASLRTAILTRRMRKPLRIAAIFIHDEDFDIARGERPEGHEVDLLAVARPGRGAAQPQRCCVRWILRGNIDGWQIRFTYIPDQLD